jgi:hypothetical protein
MKKIIAIGGEPASGKSTLIKKFMADATNDWKDSNPVQLVYGHFSDNLGLMLMGIYEKDAQFPGTDRFSMAVQPKAEEFIKTTTHKVLFEGDRLFNAKFLEFCLDQDDVDLQIIYLKVNPGTIDFRHTDRQDTQSEQFLKGRATKYSNIMGNMILKPNIEVWKNETLDDLNTNVENLIKLVR